LPFFLSFNISGFEGIPISDLAGAQYTYLQRYDTLFTQKFVNYYNLETEIARGKIIDNQVEMIRSAVYDNHLVNLQNILLNLLM